MAFIDISSFFNRRGITKNNILIIHQKVSYFDLLSFLNYLHFSYFRLVVLIGTMGKEVGCSFKYNRSKISTPTLKKPILSSSSAHVLSASNLTQTPISSQLDNKESTTNQNKNTTSNIDDNHSCVTPLKQSYSVQATSTSPCLTPLKTKLHIAPVELQTIKQLPPAGK